MDQPEIINRDTSLLAPELQTKLERSLSICCERGFKEVAVFEGFRTPERQMFLYSQGRTRPGKIITRALPWRSWHQYGLAVDIARKLDSGGFAFDLPYDKIASIFIENGFEWLHPFESIHFQIVPPNLSFQKAKEIFLESKEKLWDLI